MTVNLNELERVLNYLRTINNAKFSDIVWEKDGKVVESTNEQFYDFQYEGLPNKDFPKFCGWSI